MKRLSQAVDMVAGVTKQLQTLRDSTDVRWAWVGLRDADEMVTPLAFEGPAAVALQPFLPEPPLRRGLADPTWLHQAGPISGGLGEPCQVVVAAKAMVGLSEVVLVVGDIRPRFDSQLLRHAVGEALSGLTAVLGSMVDMAQGLDDYRNLRQTLAQSQIGVWRFDPFRNRVDWSEALFETWGIDPATFDHTYAAYNAGLHPDDVEAVNRTIMQAMTRAQAEGTVDYTIDHRVIRPDRSIRFIEGRGRVTTDGRGRVQAMSGVGIDVTARQQGQAQLLESESRYRLFSQLASDFVYEAPIASGHPTVIAGSFERTCGLTLAQFEEAGGWAGVALSDDAATLRWRTGELQAGRSVTADYRIRDAHGDVRWLRDRCQPRGDGTCMGGVSDITTQRRLEEHLAHAQKLEALARMAGGVAHDFNNLLTVLFGSLELIRSQSHQLPRLVNEAAEEIANATQRGADLTRSLLAFARKNVSVAQAIDLTSTTHAMRSLIERALGGQIRVSVVGSAPAAARIDVGQLQLVVLNLALNARDAMPGGGTLVLSVSQRRFVPSDLERPPELVPGDYAALEVTDTGTGMAPDVLARLFEPFFSTKGPDGTGLGLATSFGVIRQAGGTMAVHSEVGHGTTFTIYLPAEAERRPEPPQAMQGSEVVVLVEDEPVLRRLASRALAHRGYLVKEAESAEEGQALVRAHPDVKLLVSDLFLPALSGSELADWATAHYPNLKVLLMSGFLGDEMRVKASISTRYPLLPKPFTPDGLARRVREVLDSGHRS